MTESLQLQKSRISGTVGLQPGYFDLGQAVLYIGLLDGQIDLRCCC